MSVSRFNPFTLFLYFLTVTGVGVFAEDPILPAISFVGALTLTVKRREVNQRKIAWGTFLLVGSVVANMLLSHNGATVLFVLNDSPMTLESLCRGAQIGLSVCTALLWFSVFSRLMTGDKTGYLLGFLSPETALVFSMSLRSVPLLERQAEKMRRARRGIGAAAEEGLAAEIRNGATLFSGLCTWALEGGVTTSDSMSARGYGTRRPTRYRLFRFRLCDGVAIGITLALGGVCAAGMILGKMQFVFYPTVHFAEKSAWHYAVWGGFALLAFLPILTVKEEKP